MATATLGYSNPVTEAKTGSKTATKTAPGKGLFARFFDAMIEARMRQAMRELAMHRHLLPDDTTFGSDGRLIIPR